MAWETKAGTENGPRCCREPACFSTAYYAARGANCLPQTPFHRELRGRQDLPEDQGSYQMKRTPDKAVVQFFPGSILATAWWVNSHSTSPARLGTVSTLWDEHRIGSSRPFLRKSVTPGMQAVSELSQRKGSCPLLWEGIETKVNWSGLPGILGDHTNDFFFTESFNYEKLSRW